MGFLLGLPLKLLALVFGLLRVLIPVLLLIFGHSLAVAEIRRPQALGISKKRRTPLQGTGVYRGLQGSQGR